MRDSQITPELTSEADRATAAHLLSLPTVPSLDPLLWTGNPPVWRCSATLCSTTIWLLSDSFKSFSPPHFILHVILEDKRSICCLIYPRCHKLLTSPVRGPNGVLDNGRRFTSKRGHFVRTEVESSRQRRPTKGTGRSHVHRRHKDVPGPAALIEPEDGFGHPNRTPIPDSAMLDSEPSNLALMKHR